MMERESLLNRIRKLLNMTLAKGATEAEAEVALTMAQRLMDEHNIKAVDLPDGEAENFATATAWEGKQEIRHYSEALPVVEEMFVVKAVMQETRVYDIKTKVKILIFGDSVNTENAIWAINFLGPLYRQLWTAYRLRTGADSRENTSYYRGLTCGLVGKLRADRESQDPESTSEETESTSERALACLSTRLERAYKAEFPNMGKARGPRFPHSYSAFSDGIDDGRNINLARPLDRERRLKQLESER